MQASSSGEVGCSPPAPPPARLASVSGSESRGSGRSSSSAPPARAAPPAARPPGRPPFISWPPRYQRSPQRSASCELASSPDYIMLCRLVCGCVCHLMHLRVRGNDATFSRAALRARGKRDASKQLGGAASSPTLTGCGLTPPRCCLWRVWRPRRTRTTRRDVVVCQRARILFPGSRRGRTWARSPASAFRCAAQRRRATCRLCARSWSTARKWTNSPTAATRRCTGRPRWARPPR